MNETCFHTVYGDAEKKMTIGKNGTKINISDYVGLLIQSNPQILAEHPILDIEYNPDGSKKGIETLLKDFKQIESENPSDYSRIYSIYYGLISRAVEQSDINNPQLQEQVSCFLKYQPELISFADIQELQKIEDENRIKYEINFDKRNKHSNIEKTTTDLVEYKKEAFIIKIINKIKMFFKFK